jgi:hypothetical protein
MPIETQQSRRTVNAPSPITSGKLPLNRVISVVLDADEDVRWSWTSTTDGVSYVSGYTIVKRENGTDRE